jgi:hypothetical protein
LPGGLTALRLNGRAVASGVEFRPLRQALSFNLSLRQPRADARPLLQAVHFSELEKQISACAWELF